MRARALHADALVITSAVMHLNCVLLRGAAAPAAPSQAATIEVIEVPGSSTAPVGESFLIDCPALPDELAMLPSLLEQARFPPLSGLLATHADWDHLLGPLAFPGAPLGCAESSARRLAATPGEAQRRLREFDEGLYLERERPLALRAPEPLPVPGHLEIGASEVELHQAEGHTGDGMAIWAPWAGVLVAGDYLSSIEIPTLGPGGSTDSYILTLQRLRPLVALAAHVVPGHGPVLDSSAALELLDQDLAYLADLAENGARAELPDGRRSREQRRLHACNVAALSA